MTTIYGMSGDIAWIRLATYIHDLIHEHYIMVLIVPVILRIPYRSLVTAGIIGSGSLSCLLSLHYASEATKAVG